MTQKNDSSGRDHSVETSGPFGTQAPRPFAGDANDRSQPASSRKPQATETDRSDTQDGDQHRTQPNDGFGTLKAPPLELAAEVSAQHNRMTGRSLPVVHAEVSQSYHNSGDKEGSLSEVMRTCQLAGQAIDSDLFRDVCAAKPNVQRRETGKSSWNLRIHQRDVSGQISGIINHLVSETAPASGLESAISQGLDAPEYEVLERIGAGNMGVIYQARQTSLNRELVIKTLKGDSQSPEHDQALFVSEAVVTANLVHPNIVPIHDLGRTADGKLFYSMKHVTGSPWNTTLKARSLEENLDIFIKVCDAVAYAHSRGVINRDLKPENVMIGEFGEVIVLDWGLAITTSAFEKQDSVIVEFRGAAGSPVYMAPEMLHDDVRGIGTHSDIYLLGAILFELLEGFPPHLVKAAWGVSSPDEQLRMVFRAVLENQIEEDVVHKDELMQIARRAMSTEPSDRFTSVERLQDAIREYRITGRAEELNRSIAENRPDDYDDYQSAVALFSEALRKWPDNRRALEGNQTARIAYAKLARKKGDYDLGLHVVSDENNAAYRTIRSKLRKARSTRLMIRFTWTLLFIAAISLTGFTIYQDLRLTNADAAVAEAEEQKQQKTREANERIAEADKKVAEADRLASAQIAEAEQKTTAAAERVRVADLQVAEAEENKEAAVEAAMQAVERARTADEAAKVARMAQEEALMEAAQAQMLADTERAKAEMARAQVEVARAEQHQAQLDSHLTRIDTSMELGLYSDVVDQVDKALDELQAAQNPKFNDRIKDQLNKQRKVATERQRNTAFHLDDVPGLSAFSADGNTFAMIVVGTKQELQVWHRDPASDSLGDFAVTELGSAAGVRDIALSGDGSLICAAGQGVRLMWRRVGTEFQPIQLDAPQEAISYRRCLLSPAGEHLYLVGSDDAGTVEIFAVTPDSAELLMRQPVWEKTGFGIGVQDAALLPDESALIVEPAKDHFTTSFPLVWNDGVPRFEAVSIHAPTLKGMKDRRFTNARFQVESLQVSADGTQLALISGKKDVLVLPRAVEATEKDFPFVSPADLTRLNHFQSVFPIRRLVFSSDGRRVATLPENRYIEIWDLVDGVYTASEVDGLYHPGNQAGGLLRGHSREVLALTFVGKSDSDLLTISKDQTLRSWDLKSYSTYIDRLQQLRDTMISEFSARSDRVSLREIPDSEHGRTAIPERFLNREFRFTSTLPQPPAEAAPADEPLPASQVALTGSSSADPISLSQGRNVFSARFSNDGERLLIGSDDLAAHVFQSRTGGRTMSMSARRELFFEPNRNNFLEGHVSEIASIRFLPPRGELLLTSDYFGSISVWNSSANGDGIGYEKSRLLSEYSFSEFAVSDDGEWIVAGGAESNPDIPLDDATLSHLGLVWRVADIRQAVTARPTMRLDGQHPRFAITAVAISSDSTRIVTAGRRGRIVIWDRNTSDVIATTDGAHHGDGVSGVFFLSDNELITAGFDGQVLRWTIENGQLIQKDVLLNGQFVVRLRPAPDRTRFAVSDIQPPPDGLGATTKALLNVSVFAITGEKVMEIDQVLIPEQDPELAVRHDVSWSLEGDRLLYIVDGVLRLYDSSNWTVVQKYRLGEGDLTAVRGTLAPGAKDGATCAATFDGRFAHLWNLSDGSHLAEFRTHSYRTTASFSFDRRFVATGSETIRVFESDEEADNHGQTLLRMKTGEAHKHPIASVAFSPQPGDYRFASVDLAGEVKLWNWSPDAPAAFQQTREIPPPDKSKPSWGEDIDFGNTIAWRADASMLATVQQGHATLWRLTDDGPQSIALSLPEEFDCRFNQAEFSKTRPLVVAAGVGYSNDTGRIVSIALVWRIDANGTATLIGIAEGDHSTVSRSREQQSGVTSVAVDDSADELLTGGADGRLIRWQLGFIDTDSPEELSQIVEKLLPGDQSPHVRAISSLDVAADGRAVSADEQGTIHIWPSTSD